MAVFADPFAPKKTKGRSTSALSGYPELTPEDEDSLLASLGNVGMGGLSMVGNILDTPGALVRGVLAGRNPLPGIFEPSLRTSGRDLLETYGVLGSNREGFHPIDDPMDAFGDVLGFGAEVALDPTTYALMGARAVGKLGAAAGKLGVLPKATYEAASMVPKTGLRRIGAKLFGKPLEESTQALKTGPRVGRMTQTWDDAVAKYMELHPGMSDSLMQSNLDSALKAAGATVDDVTRNDPLGFLIGFGNPFSSAPAKFGISAKTPGALKIAEKLDVAGDALRYSLPGRIGAQLFSKQAKMGVTKPGQIAAADMAERELRAKEVALGMRNEVDTLLLKTGLDYNTADTLLKRGLEIPNPTGLAPSSLLTPAEQSLLGPHAGTFDQAIEKITKYDNESKALKGSGVVERTPGEFTPVGAGAYAPDLRGRVPGVSSLPGQPGHLDDMINHTFRRANILDSYGSSGFGAKVFNQSADSSLRRSDELFDLPADTLDRLTLDKTYMEANTRAKKASEEALYARRRWKEQADPALKSIAREDLTLAERVRDRAWEIQDQMVLDKMGRSQADVNVWKTRLETLESDIAYNRANRNQAPTVDQLARVAEYKRLISQHRHIGETLSGLPPEAAGRKFYAHTMDAFASGVEQNLRSAEASQGLMDFAVRFAQPDGDGVPLFDVLHGTKFAKGASPEITERATQLAMEKLDHLGYGDLIANLRANATTAMGSTGIFTDSDILRHFKVPKDIAGDITRMVTGFKDPEVLKPALEVVDWLTSRFKTGVTSPWPSFFTRNFTQGVWQNFVLGAASKRWYSEAQNLVSGGQPTAAILDLAFIKNAVNEGLITRNVDEAAEFLRRSLYQYNVSGQTFKNELTGGYKPVIENSPGHIPGMDGNKQTFSKSYKNIPATAKEVAGRPLTAETKAGQKVEKAWNVGTAVPRAFIKAGEDANTWSESLHRTAGFLSLLEQGFDPHVAAAKIRSAHVDYADLSDVEKVIMRRMVPFYAWSRKMTPTVLRELAETPGGYTGQLAQASAATRGEDESFIPDYLQGGLGMRIGAPDEAGKQTFLTNIDLAPEAVFEPLSLGPNAASETGLKMLGMMNPLFKAPLESMVGKQFFTGRDMRDLHSTLGLPPALEQLASNSPLARVKSTGSQIGQILSGRKDPAIGAFNIFTGLKFSDVDLPKHKSIKTRELIQDEMRQEEGVGVFERMYVPKELQLELVQRAKAGDPEAIRQVQLLQLTAIEQKRAAAKRKAQNMPGGT